MRATWLREQVGRLAIIGTLVLRTCTVFYCRLLLVGVLCRVP